MKREERENESNRKKAKVDDDGDIVKSLHEILCVYVVHWLS